MQVTLTVSEEEYDEIKEARRCKSIMDNAIDMLNKEVQSANENLIKINPMYASRAHGFIDGVNYALKLLNKKGSGE